MSSTRKTKEHLKSAGNLRGVAGAVGAAEVVGAALPEEVAEAAALAAR